MAEGTVDLVRVGALGDRVLEAVRPELERQPFGNENVFTVLNGLAIPVALILAGTGFDAAPIEFFRRALANQMAGQGLSPADAPAWLAPAADKPQHDAEWVDAEGGSRLVLSPRYYDDPERVAGALLLTDAPVSRTEIAGWTPEQRKAAAEWALSTHFAALGNSHVIVPPRPSFVREGRDG